MNLSNFKILSLYHSNLTFNIEIVVIFTTNNHNSSKSEHEFRDNL